MKRRKISHKDYVTQPEGELKFAWENQALFESGGLVIDNTGTVWNGEAWKKHVKRYGGGKAA